MTDIDTPMNLRALLDGIEFPVEKIEIVSYADEHDASEEALEALRALPQRSYPNIKTLNRDLGLIETTAGAANIWGSAPGKNESP